MAAVTLTALTFLLAYPVTELRIKLEQLTAPPPTGRGLKDADLEVKHLKHDLRMLKRGARALYRSFLFFVVSMLLMLALFDTFLAAYTYDLFVEIANVGFTGGTMVAGFYYMLRGAAAIKDYYLRET